MMSNCPWEEIDGFKSFTEYKRFLMWISERISDGSATSVQVEDYYIGVHFKETWYQHTASGDVWRLVAPEAPFHGYWGKVKQCCPVHTVHRETVDKTV